MELHSTFLELFISWNANQYILVNPVSCETLLDIMNRILTRYHNPFLTYEGWSICSLMENIAYYELICRHIWFYFIISYLDTWAHICQYFSIRRNISLHITVLVHMSTFGFLYEHMRLYVVKLINMLICELICWCMSSIVTKLLHIFQDEFKH